ncbi:hypothetical protein [Tortoise microvirus 53]|nr:hypothetical protein [Tortoise microvirus 53]
MSALAKGYPMPSPIRPQGMTGYQRQPLRLPVPANDNPRPRPRPANDNFRPSPRTPPAKPFSPPRVAPKGAWLGYKLAARGAARFIPVIGTALTVYEIYEWWRAGEIVPEVPEHIELNGWSHVGHCPRGSGGWTHRGWGDQPATQTQINQANSCLGGQGLSVWLPWGSPYPANSRTLIGFKETHRLGTTPYGEVRDVFSRPVGGTVTWPEYVPYSPAVLPEVVPSPRSIPEVHPGIDPFSVPPLAPVAPPVPLPVRALPYRVSNPMRAEQSVRGHGVNPRAVPRVNPRRRPPGVRERKFKLTISGSIVSNAFSFVTEGADVVEAIYEAIPESIRGTRKRGVKEQAFFIWQHLNQVDQNVMVQNLLYNHFEDKFFGAIGERMKRANQVVWEQGYGNLRVQFGLAH